MGSKIKLAIIGLALATLIGNYSPLNAADNKPQTPKKQVSNLESKVSDEAYDEAADIKLMSEFYLKQAENGNLWKSDPDKALKFYEKAIELNPNCMRAYYHGGELLENMKRSEDALKWHLNAVKIDPLDPTTWRHAADSYNRLGMKKEAIGAWEKIIELYESKDEKVLKHMEEIKNSDEYSDLKIPEKKKDSEIAIYSLMIGQAYNDLGQYDKGKECLEKAMSKPKYQKHQVLMLELERSKEGLNSQN